MDNPNRINPTSITGTTSRQTPQNDFGTVLARTVSTAVQTGAGIAGGMAMGHPVLSAAVSGVSSVASAVTNVGGGGTVGSVGSAPAAGGVGGASGTTGGNDSFALLEAQKLLKEEERRFNLEYLNLQNALQRESREFNAVSNIMKVRHDSAKAAINNIR